MATFVNVTRSPQSFALADGSVGMIAPKGRGVFKDELASSAELQSLLRLGKLVRVLEAAPRAATAPVAVQAALEVVPQETDKPETKAEVKVEVKAVKPPAPVAPTPVKVEATADAPAAAPKAAENK